MGNIFLRSQYSETHMTSFNHKVNRVCNLPEKSNETGGARFSYSSY